MLGMSFPELYIGVHIVSSVSLLMPIKTRQFVDLQIHHDTSSTEFCVKFLGQEVLFAHDSHCGG